MKAHADGRFAYDRVVVGYHGCDEEVATRLLNGEPFKASDNAYDWLGKGIYFWEYGPDRAWRFAEAQKARGKVKHPTVVGALISLGRCFDLMDTRATKELAVAGGELVKALGENVPKNAGASPDQLLRKFDCAMLNYYMTLQDDEGPGYDTVRCAFQEGALVVPQSAIYQEAHVQLVVRRSACIRGVFRPYFEA